MSEAAAEGAAEAKPKKKLNIGLVMAGLNLVVVLAGIGVIYSTRISFKRPVITEQKEREHLEKSKAILTASSKPGFMHFETMTVNLQTSLREDQPKVGDAQDPGDRPPGKLHYVTLSWSLQIREDTRVADVEPLKQIIIDRVISMLGRKSSDELATVQGRYLLRTQIADSINEIIVSDQLRRKKEEDPLITNVFFNQFTVQ